MRDYAKQSSQRRGQVGPPLQGKGGSISLSNDLLQDLIPRRSKVMVTVGPTAAMDVPGILASLDRYPHGCAEQTTSRALPLLYVNDVAKRLGIMAEGERPQGTGPVLVKG